MKTFLALAIIIYSSIIVCHKGNDSIRGVKITENFPVINDKGNVMGYDTFSTNIYYYKNQVLYYSSYHFDSTSNDSLLTSETRYYYLVFTKGKTYGYQYDKYKPVFEKKVLIDSALRQEWTSLIGFYPIFSESNLTQSLKNFNKDSGILNETYSFTAKSDTSKSGTCSLWFTKKINGIDFSLSKYLDSLNKMKLFKVRILNNPRYLKEYNITIDKIEQAFDLDEIPIKNEKELLYYFERDEKNNQSESKN